MFLEEEFVRRFFFLVLLGTLGSVGCGGGGRTTMPVSVLVTPTAGQSVPQGGSINLVASVLPQLGQGVTWSLTGPGVLAHPTTPPKPGDNSALYSITYTAPVGVSTFTYAIATATSVDNPNASAYVPITVSPFNVFPNVQPVSVNGGPVQGQIYPNGGFTSVTICTPGTLNCKTIDGILVDTGSSGLRVLASALPPLPTLTDNLGNTVNECVQSVDLSYLWGTVEWADLRIAGEVARAIPIHAIADLTNPPIPSACTSHGAGADDDSQKALGANGILGVGLEPHDCGANCDSSAANGGRKPPEPAYYACSGSTCNPAYVPLAQQVTHPAVAFATDNNGVELQLPALTDASSPLNGSLIFGIETRTNNVLGNATIFTVDLNDHFTTNLASTGQSLTSSFIDSGSSGFFFPDSSLVTCPDPQLSFFCPTSLTPVTAVNLGVNAAQSTINFSVDNAANLFTDNPAESAFSTLAGPNGSGACSGGTGACSFDWGLPFFYGRSVFTSIRDRPVPLFVQPDPGITVFAPATPWWAYTTGFTKQ